MGKMKDKLRSTTADPLRDAKQPEYSKVLSQIKLLSRPRLVARRWDFKKQTRTRYSYEWSNNVLACDLNSAYLQEDTDSNTKSNPLACKADHFAPRPQLL